MMFLVTIRTRGRPDEVRAMEASTRFEIYDQIQKEGGLVIGIKENSRKLRIPAWLTVTIGSGVKRSQVIQTAKSLSSMLGAGLPISRALSVMEKQSGGKRLRAVIAGISDAIRKGSSFSDALSVYPKIFPPLFVAMVKAGEESGSLSEALSVVGTQMERSASLSRKIRGAMIYPSIVLGAIFVVAILMLIYVVPTLTNTFTQLGVEIPLATRVIVSVSDFMVANVALVFALIFSLIIGGFFFVRSDSGSAAVMAISLRLPVIGKLVKETYAARASRTLASLLVAGVPVLEALTITRDVVHARVFARVIEEAGEHVRKGNAMSASFAEHDRLYPILMSEMLAVGEETGKVAEMLKQVAEFYEEDVSEQTKNLSSIIEPVLILVIGVFVGIFAVSMIAPIYSLSSAI